MSSWVEFSGIFAPYGKEFSGFFQLLWNISNLTRKPRRVSLKFFLVASWIPSGRTLINFRKKIRFSWKFSRFCVAKFMSDRKSQRKIHWKEIWTWILSCWTRKTRKFLQLHQLKRIHVNVVKNANRLLLFIYGFSYRT